MRGIMVSLLAVSLIAGSVVAAETGGTPPAGQETKGATSDAKKPSTSHKKKHHGHAAPKTTPKNEAAPQ